MNNSQKLQAKNRESVKPNSSETACDQILNWFEQYITDQKIAIGDTLPSEDFIVQATKMSRTSVREAFTRLRALGVVESRRKRGMKLMRSPALLDLARLLGNSHIDEELIGHVGGFRSALEIGLESEIFKRTTNDDIAELQRIYKAMVAHADDPDLWNNLDCAFHEKLIRITDNKVAIWLSQLFKPFFQVVRGHVTSMSDITRERHRRVLTALENRDPVAFHDAMREHHYRKLSFENYDALGYAAPAPNYSQKTAK